MNYQIDPHLRHDFSHPPPYGGRPPGLPPRLPRQTRYGYQPGHLPLGPPPWLRRTRARLRRLWLRLRLRWRRAEYRAGAWLARRLHPRDYPVQERAVLHLLILALLLIVLFQAVLLILVGPR
jgi:hypothetical protein